MNTEFHYFTTISEDGHKSYEGYSDVVTSLDVMNERIQDSIKQGHTDHIEYAGSRVPFTFLEPEIAAAERNYSMPELQGSEKQIEWARTIRYRYSLYLGKYSEQEGKSRSQRHNQTDKAEYWIDNRFSLASTTKESQYVAEGIGNIF
jgi:hypothetical protein